MTAELVEDQNGLRLMGSVCALPTDTIYAQPVYSLDGDTFQPIQSADGVEAYGWDLSLPVPARYTQPCADRNTEPLKSYQDGTLDSFWISLRLNTADDAYYSAAALVSRPVLPPEEAPAFQAEVVVDERGYGVWGTVEKLPEDAVRVRPQFSTDGASFVDTDEAYDWDLSTTGGQTETSSPHLAQLCARAELCQPFKDYLYMNSNLWCRLYITRADGTEYATQASQVVRGIAPLPEEPPAFTTVIKHRGGAGWVLMGRFEAFTPDIKDVTPCWSLDGVQFQRSDDWQWLLDKGAEQTCMAPSQEPFSSYLDGHIDLFYVKLHITTWSGQAYDTQVAVVSRNDPQPQPEGTVVAVAYPVMTMAVFERDERKLCGRWQVTAREGTAWDTLAAWLPDTLPIELQLMQGGTAIDWGSVRWGVTWETPEAFTPDVGGSPYVIKDAAEPLDLAAGLEVPMYNGIYRLNETPDFASQGASDQVNLFINVVPGDARAKIHLFDNGNDRGALSLAFEEKPTGATAIRYYYLTEGMEDWTLVGDLLDKLPVDAVPKAKEYGDVPLFTEEDTPYREYKEAGQPFLVGIEIEGGVFDGELHTLSWPGDYDPPPSTPDFNGSGGNENNAGGGSGGSDDGNGQRPDLPDEEEPAESDDTPPPKEDEIPPSEPDGTMPEPEEPQPSTPDGEKENDRPQRPSPPPQPTLPSQTDPSAEQEPATAGFYPLEETPPAEEIEAEPTQTPAPAASPAPVSAEPPLAEEASAPQEALAAEGAPLPAPAETEPVEHQEDLTGQRESLPQVPAQTSPPGEKGGRPASAEVWIALAVAAGGGIAVLITGVFSAVGGGTGPLAKLGSVILKLLKRKG